MTSIDECKQYDVLIACEFSNIVRDAFREEDFDAISCDTREPERGGPHYQGNVMDILTQDWQLMIGHPPCTYLANSGVRWLHEREERWQDMIDGAVFFRELLTADIPHIAIENPVIHKYAKKIIGRGHDQTVQPYEFGHGETKRICLWLNNLPPLESTDVVDGREARVHKMPPSEERSKERSRFFEGVAEAMAKQWGGVIDADE